MDPTDRMRAALADRYRIEREIGRGGMAFVYLAQDLRHQRSVAIKVLRPELAQALGPERFLREIAIAAPLAHPHIVALYDSGEAAGLPYYVMPYVSGESLRDRLNRERQLPLDDAIRITREVADALSHAHSLGMVHRDIKPENILLGAGHAMVADFGIARAIEVAGGERITATGLAVGTPAYMSPEQARGAAALDGRSDVYALGCVLYEMLAGEPPFAGPTAQAILARKAVDPVPGFRTTRETVPPAVEAAVRTALARSPADRFPSATRFAEALAGGAGPAPRRRSRALVPAAVALIAAAVAFVKWPFGRSANTLDANLITVLPFRAASVSPAVADVAAAMPDLFWMKVTGDAGPRAGDPATALGEWRRRGGSRETGIPERDAIALARGLGAAWLVLGGLAGNEARMEVEASLLDVSSGATRIRERVAGPLDSVTSMVDALVLKLLAGHFGLSRDQVAGLAEHPVAAVQADLAGHAALGRQQWGEARDRYDQALALDSTFVLAAVAKYAAGEMHPEAARFAWEHRDRLSARDRAYLLALAGWDLGLTRSVSERIAQWEAALRASPDHLASVVEYGWNLATTAGLVSGVEWRGRARRILERVHAADPSAVDAEQLVRLAIMEDDTAGLERYLTQYRAHLPPNRSRAMVDYFAAAYLDDSVGLVRVRPVVFERVTGLAFEVLGFALVQGRGLDDGERVAAMVRDESGDHAFVMKVARARGRYEEWRGARDAYYATLPAVLASAHRVRDALHVGEPSDPALALAARELDAVADGSARQTTPRGDRALAHCWRAQWRLAHGDTRGARDAIRYLTTDVADPMSFVVCASLLEVMLGRSEHRDVRPALVRLDSIVGSVPAAWRRGWNYTGGRDWGSHMRQFEHDHTLFVDNLVVSRLLTEFGDTTRALAAIRRRPHHAHLGMQFGEFAVEFLREEGALAAAAGDTAGAIRAYEAYLRYREDPDPPWREEWQQVRTALAGLVGERPSGGP